MRTRTPVYLYNLAFERVKVSARGSVARGSHDLIVSRTSYITPTTTPRPHTVWLHEMTLYISVLFIWIISVLYYTAGVLRLHAD